MRWAESSRLSLRVGEPLPHRGALELLARLPKKFGVSSGDCWPGKVFFVRETTALHKLQAKNSFGENTHQRFSKLRLQRGFAQILRQKNNASFGDGRGGFSSLQRNYG